MMGAVKQATSEPRTVEMAVDDLDETLFYMKCMLSAINRACDEGTPAPPNATRIISDIDTYHRILVTQLEQADRLSTEIHKLAMNG